MQEDLLTIRINIDGTSYPLSIPRDKEEVFRRAEKEINHLLASVQSQFDAERKDYLAVVAMEFAVKALTLEAQAGAESGTEELAALDRRLGDYLNKLK